MVVEKNVRITERFFDDRYKRAQESSKLFDDGSKILDSRYMRIAIRC